MSKERGKFLKKLIGLGSACVLAFSMIPSTVFAAGENEKPFTLDVKGGIQELSGVKNYPYAEEGAEEIPDYITGNMLCVEENGSIIIGKNPEFDGKIECYIFIYYLNDEGTKIIQTDGQVGVQIIEDTNESMVITLSSAQKLPGSSRPGIEKNAIYQILFECVPADGNRQNTQTYWLNYCVKLENAENMEKTYNKELIVNVNNQEVLFEAFQIKDNNYISIRDLAMAVNGTEKQFDVGYDNENKAVMLTSKKAYTATGNELLYNKVKQKKDAEKAAQEQSGIHMDMGTRIINIVQENAIKTPAKIYLDGQEINLTAYNIKGSNYFQLRDIAKLFDIGVTYDSNTKTVGVDTSISYTE